MPEPIAYLEMSHPTTILDSCLDLIFLPIFQLIFYNTASLHTAHNGWPGASYLTYSGSGQAGDTFKN